MRIRIGLFLILISIIPTISFANKYVKQSTIFFVDGFLKPAALSATNTQINISVEFGILADLITTDDPLIIEWKLQGKPTLNPQNSRFIAGPFRINVPFDATEFAESNNSVRYKTVQSIILFPGSFSDVDAIADDRYKLRFAAKLIRSKKEPRNLGEAELDGQILAVLFKAGSEKEQLERAT
ncbi:hypothetical protein L0222_28570 [bacterium]|nr:hypothetical protein [bacterium]